MYINKIAGVLLNSLINIEDCKLLVLKRVTTIIIKLTTYKSLNISLSELLLIL